MKKIAYKNFDERTRLVKENEESGYALRAELNILEGNFLVFEEHREPERTIEERLLEKDRQIELLQTNMDNAILELTMAMAMGGGTHV